MADFNDVLNFGYVAKPFNHGHIATPLIWQNDAPRRVMAYGFAGGAAAAGGGGAAAAAVPVVGSIVQLLSGLLNSGPSPGMIRYQAKFGNDFLNQRVNEANNMLSQFQSGQASQADAMRTLDSLEQQMRGEASGLGEAAKQPGLISRGLQDALAALGKMRDVIRSGQGNQNMPSKTGTDVDTGTDPTTGYPTGKQTTGQIAGPIITSTLGALLAKLFGGGQSPAQRTAAGAESNLINFQTELAKQLAPVGNQLLTSGAGAYGPVMDYYSKLLSGDRQALMQLLGPEVSQIMRQYSGASQTSAELNPRGGMPAQMRAELPFQQARDIGNLFMSVRPMAAQGLFAAGSDLSRLGLGTYGAAFGGASGAGQSAANLGVLGTQLYGQSAAAGAGWGQLLQQIGKNIPWDKIFNKSGTGGGSTSTSGWPVPLPGGQG